MHREEDDTSTANMSTRGSDAPFHNRTFSRYLQVIVRHPLSPLNESVNSHLSHHWLEEVPSFLFEKKILENGVERFLKKSFESNVIS